MPYIYQQSNVSQHTCRIGPRLPRDSVTPVWNPIQVSWSESRATETSLRRQYLGSKGRGVAGVEWGEKRTESISHPSRLEGLVSFVKSPRRPGGAPTAKRAYFSKQARKLLAFSAFVLNIILSEKIWTLVLATLATLSSWGLAPPPLLVRNIDAPHQQYSRTCKHRRWKVWGDAWRKRWRSLEIERCRPDSAPARDRTTHAPCLQQVSCNFSQPHTRAAWKKTRERKCW